ncbi:antigen 5 like allergen Cul n 1-like [Anopheles aquasalis]|uniref:antigen 5 like allergen Cul n 1-like n=1 Tax=Anopheles aquasalis TaxID=42839 RepID=UPI00215A4DBB|nr:antigen 5 like allergen Cul n 1-like [Anopheles aquasalis]
MPSIGHGAALHIATGPLVLLLLLLVCDPGVCHSNRYCSLCQDHVACGRPRQLHGDCLRYSDVNLTVLTHLRHVITGHVNHLRDKFASGAVRGFGQRYGPMYAVSWDDEMADLCRYNINSCRFAHDRCRATTTYPYSGQTLGKLTKCVRQQGARELSINVQRHVILHLVDRWFAEHRDTDESDVRHYSHRSSKRKFQIGHFLQLINCNVCKLGCSLVSYRVHRPPKVCATFILCCNYSYINIIDRPICGITPHRSPQSPVCPTQPHYRHLCSKCSSAGGDE